MTLSGHAPQSSVYGTAIAFAILSSLVVGARLATRVLIVRKPGWDDLFIGVGYTFSIVMAASICMQARYGMGLHWNTLPESWLGASVAWYWAFMWTYYAALVFTKLSILTQYLRIFPQQRFLQCCYVLLGVVSVWGLWAVLSAIFMCVPVASFWNMNIFAWDQPQCLPRITIWYLNGAINILTDCAIVALPLPVVHSLELPRKQKYILAAVFAIGYFTCLISVLRLVYIYPISVTTDNTWDSPLSVIWSSVEANTGILCCCMPTLKGAVVRYYPKLLESMRSQPVDSEASDASTALSNLKGATHEAKVTVERPAGKQEKDEKSIGHMLNCFPRVKKDENGFAELYTGNTSQDEIMHSRFSRCSSIEPKIEVVKSVDQTSEGSDSQQH